MIEATIERKFGVDFREATVVSEAMSPIEIENQAIREIICDEMLRYLAEDFRPAFANELAKNKKNPEKLADLSSYFSRALLQLQNLGCDPDKTWNIVLNENNPDAVINCLGEKRQPYVLRQLKGAFSILTTYDLLRKTAPDLFNGKNPQTNLSAMITPANVDVNRKVDLEFDFGPEIELNGKKRKVIQLVQLKSSYEGEILIARFDKDSEEEIESHSKWQMIKDKIVPRNILRIFDHGREKRKKDNSIIAGIFVMIVPAIDSDVINNDIYGRCNDENTLIEFKKQATETGLLFLI